MAEAAIKTQADLDAFVATARTRMKDLEDRAATQAERAAEVAKLLPQLQAGLDAVKLAQAEAANRPPTADDESVTRAYTLSAANRGEMADRGGVADLAHRGYVDTAHRWVGSDGGLVRMLGGMERGRWAAGLLDDPSPKSDWQREAQQRAEEIAWVRQFPRAGKTLASLRTGLTTHMRRGPAAVAKVFSDNAGEGGEWIVTIPMTALERSAELERRVEGLLPSMNVPSTSVTLPFLTSGVQPFIHGVPVSGDNNPQILPKSMAVTSDRTITVKTMTVNVPIDRDADEDSIVPAIPLMQTLVAEALRDGTEDALINGDTAATHGDTAFLSWNPRSRWSTLGSSLDHRRLCIGFRQRAYDVDGTVSTATTDYNASQTVAAYLGAVAGLSSPHGLGDVVYITSPEHYLAKILTDTNLLTVDKYGPSATLLTGEVGKIGKYPLILSEFVTADLANTGLYTGSGALTGMLLVNRSRFLMARRRSVRIEIETVVRENTLYIVASERKSLFTWDGNGVANCRWLFNLSSS
jgi:hypothetical protein